MPLPLIPVAIGLAGLLGLGAKKGYDGVQAMKDANAIGKAAESRHREWVQRIDWSHKTLQERIDELTERRQGATQTTFKRLFDFIERLDQSARIAALDRLGGFGVTHEQVRRFTAQYLEAGGSLSGAVTAVLTGAGASAATTTAVTGLATAGTGAALSGLSGAALKSAMLAWLGGGSLVSGGLGMAGGAAVLGGIVVAPAVAVAGFVVAHQGEKAKTRATEYSASVDRAVAQIEVGIEFLSRAEHRAVELLDVTNELDARAQVAIDRLWALAESFSRDDEGHLRIFATAMQLAKAESDLLRVPLFLENGDLNVGAEELLASGRILIKDTNS